MKDDVFHHSVVNEFHPVTLLYLLSFVVLVVVLVSLEPHHGDVWSLLVLRLTVDGGFRASFHTVEPGNLLDLQGNCSDGES